MKTSSMDILCCPECKELLSFGGFSINGHVTNGNFTCSKCHNSFSLNEEMVDFDGKDVGENYSRRFNLVRSVYQFFFTPVNRLLFLPCGGEYHARLEVLDRLEMFPGAKVLETAIGTGDNLPILNERYPHCSYYGNDIQRKFLKICYKKMNRQHIDTELFVADAETLPFRNESFDIVFHLGAMNLFPDKRKAILEMIRVAKAGSRIVIADESQKAGRLMNIFVGSREEIIPPIDLVPNDMEEIQLQTIWNGYGYLIEFRIPENYRLHQADSEKSRRQDTLKFQCF